MLLGPVNSSAGLHRARLDCAPDELLVPADAEIREHRVRDAAFGRDEKGCPPDAETHGPVDAVLPDHVFVGVCQQRERKLMMRAKASVRLAVLRTHTDD